MTADLKSDHSKIVEINTNFRTQNISINQLALIHGYTRVDMSNVFQTELLLIIVKNR